MNGPPEGGPFHFRMDIALLCALAFVAGLVDSVVGGGGLVQIPALFTVYPGAAPAALFGTNKLASIAGTGVAALRFARAVPVRWGAILPAAASAVVMSAVGASAVSLLPMHVVRPMVLVLLVAMAVFTLARKDFGSEHSPRHDGLKERLYAVLLGGALGFYDGFFGPGTGTFLVFLFIRFFGFDFLSASAASKFVNVATNLGALVYFGAFDAVLYQAALPMAAFNILGALAGTHLAIRRGSGFVRALFLVVVGLLIAKFAWDTFR